MKIKVIGENAEEMEAEWARQYALARAVPREKRQQVIDWIRQRFRAVPTDFHDLTFLEYISYLIDKFGAEWAVSVVVTGPPPIVFHTFGGGMMVRNEMRAAGFHEEFFGCHMDYIYVGLLEEAVLGDGQRVSKDEPDEVHDSAQSDQPGEPA